MVSATPAVGASSAAARVSAGAGQEALALEVQTTGGLREAQLAAEFCSK